MHWYATLATMGSKIVTTSKHALQQDNLEADATEHVTLVKQSCAASFVILQVAFG